MRLQPWPALLAGLGCFSLFVVIGPGQGADDEEKELREGVVKLAAALEKKDEATAKKLAADLTKKFEMDSIMYMHALRAKGGLGVGGKPDSVQPDGIEKKVIALSKKALAPDQLNSEADALAQMGLHMAALAELAAAMPPDKDKKVWLDSSAEYKTASLQLADAARAKKPEGVWQAAKKADASCLKCHDVFR